MIFRIEWPLNETERATLGNVEQTWLERIQNEPNANELRLAAYKIRKTTK
jgi:hypothetical protein